MDNVHELLKMVIPREWLFSVMPLAASIHADDIDYLYWFLILTCGILFLLVVVPLGFILWRYRRKSANQRAVSQTDHNFWLESLWTFLPFIYLAILFVWGFYQYLDMYIAPHNAMELRVIGQKWQWSIDYPKEGINVAGVGVTMAVPVNRPVKVILASQDVIHSLYFPNGRTKADAVPGRYQTLWFQPDKLGEYPILCAEYCGDLHSQMMARLLVLSEEDYQIWVERQKAQGDNLPLPELGEKLIVKLGCTTCHSTDGSPKLAPSFKNLYGKIEQLVDGTSVKIDDDYISKKVLSPQKTQAKGFPQIMPSFQGRVFERDISALIAIIKSLSEK